MRKYFSICLLAFFLINVVALKAEDDAFEVEAEGSYRMEAGASIDLAKKMALFIAKRKAVESAGKYLSRKSLIEVYELDKDEIYSLAAGNIRAEIVEEKRETAGKNSAFRVRIRARVRASDFIKAEMEDSKQDRKEAKESFRHEMEQNVSAETEPGKDIARAYRLMREKKWRIALIYIDHLEKKYPNWSCIYIAKAITHYVLHEPVFMKEALIKACRLGNQTACDDLKNIKKVHQHDFGLSIVD